MDDPDLILVKMQPGFPNKDSYKQFLRKTLKAMGAHETKDSLISCGNSYLTVRRNPSSPSPTAGSYAPNDPKQRWTMDSQGFITNLGTHQALTYYTQPNNKPRVCMEDRPERDTNDSQRWQWDWDPITGKRQVGHGVISPLSDPQLCLALEGILPTPRLCFALEGLTRLTLVPRDPQQSNQVFHWGGDTNPLQHELSKPWCGGRI
ncbi:hypothetical protein Pelo_10960 [Pelomyxa schiedti]|nr:hypothetical protein Pelo_10960 [Pelomyxa schiedti]